MELLRKIGALSLSTALVCGTGLVMPQSFEVASAADSNTEQTTSVTLSFGLENWVNHHEGTGDTRLSICHAPSTNVVMGDIIEISVPINKNASGKAPSDKTQAASENVMTYNDIFVVGYESYYHLDNNLTINELVPNDIAELIRTYAKNNDADGAINDERLAAYFDIINDAEHQFGSENLFQTPENVTGVIPDTDNYYGYTEALPDDVYNTPGTFYFDIENASAKSLISENDISVLPATDYFGLFTITGGAIEATTGTKLSEYELTYHCEQLPETDYAFIVSYSIYDTAEYEENLKNTGDSILAMENTKMEYSNNYDVAKPEDGVYQRLEIPELFDEYGSENVTITLSLGGYRQLEDGAEDILIFDSHKGQLSEFITKIGPAQLSDGEMISQPSSQEQAQQQTVSATGDALLASLTALGTLSAAACAAIAIRRRNK